MIDTLFAFLARHEAVRAGHAQRIGLTGIEYSFLISVLHLQDEGDVSVKLLAQRLYLSGAFCTTMIGKLVKRGLISKKIDEQDRRKVCLEVTPSGLKLLAELAPVQRQVNDVQFGCLSRKEFLMLCKLLEKLIDSAEQAIALQAYLSLDEERSA
ncbi:MarR family winged helix-turn-helix transcriptional regulator [Bordetella sp. 2513F-2]